MRARAGRQVGDGLLVVYWLLVGLWVIAGVAFVGALVLARLVMSPSMSCVRDSGSSDYGEPHWSWTHLGTVCEWEYIDFGVFRRDPGYGRWAFVLAMVGMGAALAIAGELIRRNRRPVVEVPAAVG
jgi:hypothetical protein